MLVVVYVAGIENGLARDAKDFTEACDFIQQIGEERINKVLITDLQPTKTVTEEQLRNLVKI